MDNSLLKCGRCNCDKVAGEFPPSSSATRQAGSYCRSCCRAYQAAYRATADGWARNAYASIQRRCLNKSGKDKSYANVRCLFTMETWLAWAVPAYNQFKLSFPGEVVSVDRINPDGDYVEGNVRLLPWRENSRLARRKLARRYKAEVGLPWRQGKASQREGVTVLLETSPVLTSPNKYATALQSRRSSGRKDWSSAQASDIFPWER